MTTSQLQNWIQHPEQLNQDSLYELRTLVARYPYFQSLRLLYLKNLYLLHDTGFGAELRKSVLYVADRRALFYLIEGSRYTLLQNDKIALPLSEQEEEPGVDRTLFLIDTFLSTMPAEHSQSTDLDYAMDYTTYLLQDASKGSDASSSHQENAPKLRGQDLIDVFLNRMEEKEERIEKTSVNEEPPVRNDASAPLSVSVEDQAVEEEEETASSLPDDLDDGCFTETLAKIYIKQHRYEKALEIIKKLSLNYPKKNAYFADQIRFLEKLIINAKSK